MMHSAITSLDDIDFDALVEASLPRMDAGTFLWPVDIETVEQKVAYLRRRAESVLAQPNALCFKCTVDGEDLAAIFGSHNGDFMSGGFSLVRPDRNGSRAFIYRPDVLESQRQFLAARGITSLRAAVPKTSPLAPGMKARHQVSSAPMRPLPGSELHDGIEIRLDSGEG